MKKKKKKTEIKNNLTALLYEKRFCNNYHYQYAKYSYQKLVTQFSSEYLFLSV